MYSFFATWDKSLSGADHRIAKAKHTNLSELIRRMLHAEADKLETKKREAA